jgi:hypothetical protein
MNQRRLLLQQKSQTNNSNKKRHVTSSTSVVTPATACTANKSPSAAKIELSVPLKIESNSRSTVEKENINPADKLNSCSIVITPARDATVPTSTTNKTLVSSSRNSNCSVQQEEYYNIIGGEKETFVPHETFFKRLSKPSKHFVSTLEPDDPDGLQLSLFSLDSSAEYLTVTALAVMASSFRKGKLATFESYVNDVCDVLIDQSLFQISFSRSVSETYFDSHSQKHINLSSATPGRGFCQYIMHAQCLKYYQQLQISKNNYGSFPFVESCYPYQSEFKDLITKEIDFLSSRCDNYQVGTKNDIEQQELVMLARLQYISKYIDDKNNIASNAYLTVEPGQIIVPKYTDIVVDSYSTALWGSMDTAGYVFLRQESVPILIFEKRESNQRFYLSNCSILPNIIEQKKKGSGNKRNTVGVRFEYIKKCFQIVENFGPFAGAYDGVDHFHLIAISSSVTQRKLDVLIHEIAAKIAVSLLQQVDDNLNSAFGIVNKFKAHQQQQICKIDLSKDETKPNTHSSVSSSSNSNNDYKNVRNAKVVGSTDLPESKILTQMQEIWKTKPNLKETILGYNRSMLSPEEQMDHSIEQFLALMENLMSK